MTSAPSASRRASSRPAAPDRRRIAHDHLQTRLRGGPYHVATVGLDAAAGDQQRTRAAPLELRGDADGQKPALVGVEARHFGEQRPTREALTNLGDRVVGRRSEGVGREPVGNDHRVDSESPHELPHVAADGGDQSGLPQAPPVDAVEPEGVVGVPQDRHAGAQARLTQQPVEVQNRVGGVPFLG